MSELSLRNRQRECAVDLKRLRLIIHTCLRETPEIIQFEIGIHLVATPEMTRLNEIYLHHPGSTDVITFNHAEHAGTQRLYGEIFICTDEAVANAHRFHTSWQAELVRYAIHGILHLLGYRDDRPEARRRMQQVENRLWRGLDRRFLLSRLAL